MRSPVRSRLAPPEWLSFLLAIIMNHSTKFYFFWLFFYLFISSLFMTRFIYMNGIISGTRIFLLVWSLYILCIPGGHGQLIVGLPMQLIKHKNVCTESLFWPAAALINLITYLVAPSMYLQTPTTGLLYRIISQPNPYWLIILISLIGTSYNGFSKESYFDTVNTTHKKIRDLIVAVGAVIFILFVYKDAIVLLNALI
jgi:hypothetical protein